VSVEVPSAQEFKALADEVTKQGGLIADHETRLKALESASPPVPPEPPIPPQPPTSAPKTFAEAQALLDKGGDYDWTGMAPISGKLLTLRVAGTKVKGLDLRGPQWGQKVAFTGGEHGVVVRANDCVIEAAHIAGCGSSAIWCEGGVRTKVLDSLLEDCEYGGVFVISGDSEVITGNLVRRIGANGGTPDNHNAYGIVFTRYSGPVSKKGYVARNIVEDVPGWHGGDCHSGDDILWEDNTFRRCARGLFITTGGSTPEPASNRVTSRRNRYELKGWKQQAGGTNAVAETYYRALAAQSLNNAVSSLYPAAIYNLSNSSTLTESGTTRFTE
jgi:hypothetical protein